MSCAGCEDCPSNAWHLHVTVRFMIDGVEPSYVSATGYRQDMERIGLRPISIVNVMRDKIRSYLERIPTKHFVGTEMEAVRELFLMGHRLANLGWHPTRLKIEGDWRIADVGRVLYYEAHVKNPSQEALYHASRHPGHFAVSKSNHLIVTARSRKLHEIHGMAQALCTDPRIEACVLDTNEKLDEAWIGGQ